MSINYSTACIDARLNAVVTTIGSSGNLKLLSGSTVLSTITLATPCGTVSGGVLTFTTPRLDPSVAVTGSVDGARIEDSAGAIVVYGLTVGIPLSGAEIIISNGLNSTLVTATQTVSFLSGTFIGS